LKFLTQSLALNFEGQEKMFFAFNYGLKLLAPNFKFKKKFEAKKKLLSNSKVQSCSTTKDEFISLTQFIKGL